MKQKLKKRPILEQWFYTQSPLVITRPALRETVSCLLFLVSGFVLACGQLAGQPAPFVLGLLAAAGGGLKGLCTLIGAIAGALTMQSFSRGLELTSAGLLTFVTMYIFGSLWVTKQSWFRCLVPGIMRSIVGAIFLFSRQLTPLLLAGYAQNVLLSALSPLAFDALLQKKRRSTGAMMALAFFLIGLSRLPLPWNLNPGIIAACGVTILAARRTDPGTSAAVGVCSGLALDTSLMSGGIWVLTITAGALAGTCISRQHKWIRTLLSTVGMGAAMLYLGDPQLMEFADLGIGVLLSLVLPGTMIVGREESAIEQSSALVEQRLTYGETALHRLYAAIGLDPEQKAQQEREHIFDKAANKVCRQCTRYSTCWERNAQSTYQTLRSALGTILDRGEAQRDDFPTEFAQECRHMEGLLVALNQELSSIACRSQFRSRNEETRLIASQNLLHMSELLEENARQLRSVQITPQEAYTVKVGVAAKGRRGARISGDRGVCFHTGDGRLYAMLCDGMGTGSDAAQESTTAVDTLTDLIQSGMQPDHAMEFLNGMYILRDTGCFSTMDILELSLITGQGTLYKWGAAPSYVKSGTIVKKLGTAAPPPGLGVGNTSSPEVIRLSLWGGDMLVLVSDGVVREETEDLLRSYDGENVKELASLLTAQAEAAGGEDDMTAAVLRLDELAP